ncbi:hypothetical protein AKJ09_11076 [Labilithrix luteola]|uniref:Uncharacterized protein n=1 Tax=Labilithrix luteola TaxID=1391654 RepID=A0A0K1QFB3_9BACT|nr:hypothetical protein AKJ09_11076 [Labilithrix luteola]
MVDFEKGARGTPFAVLADERTLHTVTFEHFPSGRTRHVPVLRRRLGSARSR